jgi:uncharacterized membrane protein
METVLALSVLFGLLLVLIIGRHVLTYVMECFKKSGILTTSFLGCVVLALRGLLDVLILVTMILIAYSVLPLTLHIQWLMN